MTNSDLGFMATRISEMKSLESLSLKGVNLLQSHIQNLLNGLPSLKNLAIDIEADTKMETNNLLNIYLNSHIP